MESGTNLVIAEIGPPESGKSTGARYASSLEVFELDPQLEGTFDKIIAVPNRWLLSAAGYTGFADANKTEPQSMADFHRKLRLNGKADRLFDPLLKFSNSAIIIDALRHPTDVENLLTFGEEQDFVVVPFGFDSVKPAIRRQRLEWEHEERLIQNDRKHMQETFEEAEIEWLGNPSDPYASNGRAAMDYAQVVIDSDVELAKMLPIFTQQIGKVATRLQQIETGRRPAALAA